MATLLVETSQGPVAIQLRGPSVIGRDETCLVRIDHATLSRRHAKLAPTPDGSWALVDLGSQNGCRIAGHRVRGTAPIPDGATLRFGRVRGWLFRDTVPHGWTPPPDDVAAVDGREVTCPTCGKASWAPLHAAGLQLACKACGAPLVVEDSRDEVDGECAACHGAIARGDDTHRCPSCEAVHHADCWAENRGCATYGCEQSGVLDRAGRTAGDEAEPPVVPDPATAPPAPAQGGQVDLAVTVLAGLAGLATFGVPSLAAAGWLGSQRKLGLAGAALVACIVGALASGFWWLGWFRTAG